MRSYEILGVLIPELIREMLFGSGKIPVFSKQVSPVIEPLDTSFSAYPQDFDLVGTKKHLYVPT